MLAAEKTKATFIAPIGIGLALFVVELAGVYYTGGSVNPARSFGPCVAAANFQSYHWIYWIAPTLGAILAAGYYHFVKFMNYEDVNPGQDSAEGAFDPQVERADSNPNELDMDRQGGRSRGQSGNSQDWNKERSGNNAHLYGQRNSDSFERPHSNQAAYGQAQQRQAYSQQPQDQVSYGRQQQQYGQSRSGQAPYIPADVVQGMEGRV